MNGKNMENREVMSQRMVSQRKYGCKKMVKWNKWKVEKCMDEKKMEQRKQSWEWEKISTPPKKYIWMEKEWINETNEK